MSEHMERAWEFLGQEFGLTDSQADYAAHRILDPVLAEVERMKGVLARAHIVIAGMVDHANTSGQVMLNELADEGARDRDQRIAEHIRVYGPDPT